MGRPELLNLLKEKAKLEKLIDADPVRFFQPNPGGQYEFLTCEDPQIKGRYFFAGNKTGKTTGAAILAAEYATGEALWGREWRKVHHRVPSTGFIYCEDFATHEQTVIPTFLSWIPKRYLSDRPLERGPTGSVNKILLRNRTVIYLRTYDQGYLKAEGKDYDWGWNDEPPPRDIFTAQWRGLIARDGEMWIAATLLSQEWLYDEMSQDFVRVFDASMYENKWIGEQARTNFEAMLTDDEKQIRIYGKPSSTLSGTIYPSFKDGSPFVVEQIEIPWDVRTDQPWPVVLGIDPHERKPLYCEWAYITPDNGILWFDYALIPSGGIGDIFDKVTEIEKTHAAPTTLVVMDPNRGTAIQLGGSSWRETFEEKGYDVVLGDDNGNFGRGKVREMLAYTTNPDGSILTPPRMRWMEALRGKGGPIYQMVRHTWEDHARGSRFEKGLKEKEKEKNKDFPDIHRYVAAAKLDFKLLTGSDSGIVRFGGKLNGPQENPYVKGASNPGSGRIDRNEDAGSILERFGASNLVSAHGRNSRSRW